MGQKTDSQLNAAAVVIRDEVAVGANTAQRVGGLFEDLSDSKANKLFVPLVFADVAAVAAGADSTQPFITVISTKLLYVYVAVGSGYTVDNSNILATKDGGDTRYLRLDHDLMSVLLLNATFNSPRISNFVPATGIQLDRESTYYNNYTVVGATNIIKAADDVVGGNAYVVIVANGTNIPTIDSNWATIGTYSDSYNNVNGAKNEYWFYKTPDGLKYEIRNL
jgi:hypothetical protein